MPITIVKETIEINQISTDSDGSAFIQKRINLKEGQVHNLLQTDIFQDTYTYFQIPSVLGEVVVSPYPAVPTNMNFQNSPLPATNRYASAGDDSVLFKSNFVLEDGKPSDINQFPSAQIAANQALSFYTDHIFISMHLMATPDTELNNIAFSFMFTMMSKNVSVLTHSMGVLAESHDAMCSLLMSNGHMVSKADLRGNVFPMWRYGGIRPEHTLSPEAAGSFFLNVPSTDEELMQTTAQVRSAVADARTMGAYDAAFGARFPDWCRFGLNEGLVAGAVRDQWPPIKHADNGNVLCL